MSRLENVDKNYKTLKGRVFYLDFKTVQNRSKIKNYITRLGGTVGEFLDKGVKYLITDRNPKDWPVKDKNLINNDQTQAPEIPSNRVSDLLPRGKQLALRASVQPSINFTNQQSSKTITDAIEIAYRRGIKILEAQAVLDFCSIQIRQLENPNCDTPKTSPRIPRATIREFKGAFIKLEDVDQRYRPSAKEFKEWPKIYFDADPFMCPFIPPSKVKKFSENNDGNVANTVETGGMTGNENNNGTNNNTNVNINANVNTNTNTNTNINNNNNSNISINININNQLNQLNHTATGNNISSRIAGTPEIRVNYGMNTKTFEGLGIQTPKASTNATNDFRELNRPTPLRKQNALQYCEICGITFKSISEHINSATHQSHLKQKENFKDLFSVIKSLPKWTDICQENDATENPCDNTADYSVDFEYPHYPSLTPPSMPSTTIKLTPCSTVKAVGGNTNTKGSFLPLHDYINNNNNSKNGSFKVKEVNSLTGTFKMRQVNILGNLNNNNNFSNIANNININKNSSNFKIFNSNYSYSNINNNNNNNSNNSKNFINMMNASKLDNCKIVNDSRNINNFEQLFSDDEENINEDEIEASCFTPPFMPPLLYPELDIPEEILRQKTNTIKNNNDDYADDNAYSLEF